MASWPVPDVLTMACEAAALLLEVRDGRKSDQGYCEFELELWCTWGPWLPPSWTIRVWVLAGTFFSVD